MLNRPILVLLPIFNGAEFLEAQIESVLTQLYKPVFLICRDDGSRDASFDILTRAQERAPDRILVLRDKLGNLGASASFALLLRHALDAVLPSEMTQSQQAPFVALCDQDDIWHPNKLAICADHLERLERAHPDVPALVHSDLRVVTEDGSEIAPSMARYQGLRTENQGLGAQLLSNSLTGCTCLMNRRLIEESLPIPAEAIMHDWWLSLVASARGVRTYIDTPLIDYRQHRGNAIGAKARESRPLHRLRVMRWFDNRHAAIFRLNARQARAFLDRYGGTLTFRQRCLLWAALGLYLPIPPVQRVIYRLLRRI